MNSVFSLDSANDACGPNRLGSGGQAKSATPAAIRRAIVSCGVGQMFELYDFLIYAFMAAPLSRAFFPSDDPIASLLATFATFAVGFLMRPVGALVIGSYGDKHGRRAALVLTIGLMAVGTGAIGLIPSYATLGIAAPVLLVLCRIAQGFSAGGEWGGAAAFLAENAPARSRGFISSFQQAATAVGLLLATQVSYLLTRLLEPAAFDAWGWRMAFLLGFVLGPVGHFLRKHVQETPAFSHALNAADSPTPPGQAADAPLVITLRDHAVPGQLAGRTGPGRDAPGSRSLIRPYAERCRVRQLPDVPQGVHGVRCGAAPVQASRGAADADLLLRHAAGRGGQHCDITRQEPRSAPYRHRRNRG